MMPFEGNSLQVWLSSGESAEMASAGHPLLSFLITGRQGQQVRLLSRWAPRVLPGPLRSLSAVSTQDKADMSAML